MSLEQRISKGIMEAMKAKDTVRLTTFFSLFFSRNSCI